MYLPSFTIKVLTSPAFLPPTLLCVFNYCLPAWNNPTSKHPLLFLFKLLYDNNQGSFTINLWIVYVLSVASSRVEKLMNRQNYMNQPIFYILHLSVDTTLSYLLHHFQIFRACYDVPSSETDETKVSVRLVLPSDIEYSRCRI